MSERWENLPSFALQALENGHERYKSCMSIGHAFQPHPVIPCGTSTVHALVSFPDPMHPLTVTVLVHVHEVCAQESSSFK